MPAPTDVVRPEDVDMPSGWETWGPQEIRRHVGQVARRIDEIVGAHGGESLLQQATRAEADGEAAYKHAFHTEMIVRYEAGVADPSQRCSDTVRRSYAEQAAEVHLAEWKRAEGQRRAVRDELAALQSVLSACQTLFRDVMRQAGR